MDKQIIEGCIRGERKAMEMLFQQFKGKVRSWSYRYSKSDYDIDEILQESFIKIFNNLRSFNHTGTFDAWARAVVTNTAINYYRKNLKHTQSSAWYEEAEEKAYESAEIIHRLSLEELHSCIRQLPEGYRMVFILFAIEGYSHKEISEMLQIKENTSSSQYAKAKKFLIRLINKMQLIQHGK